MNAEKLIKETVERIKSGQLTDFSPLIALFQFERKPMTLDGHFMFMPLFSVEYPKYLTLQCGRQVSKSYTLSETLILTTGMIESFSSLYIAPRYDQLKRFHNQVLSPMLKTSGVRDLLLDKSGSDSIEMKTFLNNNTLMLEHAYSSADRTRGASGISRCCVDESTSGDTKIAIFRLTDQQDGVYYISDRPEIVPISEVKQGDIVMSFTSEGCIYSPVVRDASYHGRRAVFKVTTQSGRSLCCTADHMLQTNKGGMRLSEVIEYGCNCRNGARAGAEGWHQRLCFKRNCRNIARRCTHRQTRTKFQQQLPVELESRGRTERLLGVQSEHIIRVRNWSGVREAESRLRRLLGDTKNQVIADVFIACVDGLSHRGLPENGHVGTARSTNRPDRPSTVVRRRWEPYKRFQYWQHRYKQFHGTGGNTAVSVATDAVGRGGILQYGDTLQYRKDCSGNLFNCRRICAICRPHKGRVAGESSIQDSDRQDHMSGVWARVSEAGAQHMLLGGVPEDLSKTKQTSISRKICREESRGDISKTRCVPRRPSGGDSGEISRAVCEPDRRGESCPVGVSQETSAGAYRRISCEKTLMACAYERRSGIRAETEGGAAALLSKEDGGSRAACAPTRASEEIARQAEKQAKTARVSTQIPCGTSRDIRRPERTRECAQKREDEERSRISGETERVFSSKISQTTGQETRGGVTTGRFVYDRIVTIEYVGEEDVYDIEAVGTHNYILANGMCSYNCQDINPDFMPVFESTTDASKFGVIQSTGTAKTSDTLLALQFSKSSQCHWAIKCSHCDKWNIADEEEQLFKMIGKEGLSCAFCGKILNPRDGGWLPKFPERQRYHAGYHVPQIILPMHCENAVKWRVLRSRQTEWDSTKFKNEILGVACDSGSRILTVDDLVKAQGPWENSLDNAAKMAKEFTTIFVGVDWSGGGGGFSRTAISVIGHRSGHRDTCVLFLETLPHGLTPEEEADRVAAVYARVGAQMLAHDYTGAGFVRESVLLGRHPYLRDHIYPFAYVFRTGKQLVTYQESGSRKSANVDKTRSLLLTFNSIRSGLLRIPKFNPANPEEPILEMLNIVERPQEFSKASIKDVYILQRAAGRYDDAAHAVNIAYIAQCDLTEDWPNFSMDPKYEMSEAALNELTGGSQEVAVF